MKKFQIGNDFKTTKKDYIYIDKTLFIKQVIKNPKRTIVITRPRNFGKTFNLLMLKEFLDNSLKKETSDNPFLDTEVWDKKHECQEHYREYSVIFLSFKGLNMNEIKQVENNFNEMMIVLYKQHFNEKSISENRTIFKKLVDSELTREELQNAVSRLINIIYEESKKTDKKIEKFIVLVDDYDKFNHPIYFSDESDESKSIMDFFRSVYVSIIKNKFVHKIIFLGIFPIPIYDTLSSYGDCELYTMEDTLFSNHFGFTNDEIKEIAPESLKDKLHDLQKWYGGYRIGNHQIMNPWSFLNCFEEKRKCESTDYQSYWPIEVDNKFFEYSFSKMSPSCKKKFKKLATNKNHLSAKIIRCIPEKFYNDIYTFSSLLFYAGYLTINDDIKEQISETAHLKIPNQELRIFFHSIFENFYKISILEKEYFEKKSSNYESKIINELQKKILDLKLEEYDKIEYLKTLELYLLDGNREAYEVLMKITQNEKIDINIQIHIIKLLKSVNKEPYERVLNILVGKLGNHDKRITKTAIESLRYILLTRKKNILPLIEERLITKKDNVDQRENLVVTFDDAEVFDKNIMCLLKKIRAEDPDSRVRKTVTKVLINLKEENDPTTINGVISTVTGLAVGGGAMFIGGIGFLSTLPISTVATLGTFAFMSLINSGSSSQKSVTQTPDSKDTKKESLGKGSPKSSSQDEAAKVLPSVSITHTAGSSSTTITTHLSNSASPSSAPS
jgi:Predicted AAA-ATPase